MSRSWVFDILRRAQFQLRPIVRGTERMPRPRLKCEIHGEATREYRACIHVMIGGPISLFQEATEHTSSRDGEAGWMVCSECAELDEEPLLANTTLICGNCADRLMADQDFVR
jgi:hypothetical protein